MSETDTNERVSTIEIGGRVVRGFTGPVKPSGELLSITSVFFVDEDGTSVGLTKPQIFKDSDPALPGGCVMKLCCMMRKQQQKELGTGFIHAEVKEYTDK